MGKVLTAILISEGLLEKRAAPASQPTYTAWLIQAGEEPGTYTIIRPTAGLRGGRLVSPPAWRDLSPSHLVSRLDALNEENAQETFNIFKNSPRDQNTSMWVGLDGKPVESPSVRGVVNEIQKLADKGYMVNITHMGHKWSVDRNSRPSKKMPLA